MREFKERLQMLTGVPSREAREHKTPRAQELLQAMVRQLGHLFLRVELLDSRCELLMELLLTVKPS
jgi:hypothetical protein